jgi:hypothetical protein
LRRLYCFGTTTVVDPPEPPQTDELIDFIRSCIAYFAPRPVPLLPPERQREYRMTFGCCVQTVRYAEAFLILRGQGFSLESRTTARAALEHAATVEFAFLHVGGLDMLARSAEHTSYSIRERMAGWTGDVGFTPDPLDTGNTRRSRLPALSKSPSNDPRQPILDALDPEKVLLQPGYAVLSQGVHVTDQAVRQFFSWSEDRGTLIVNARAQDELADYAVFLVAASCMLVTWMYAHIREDADKLEELDHLSDDLFLPVRLDAGWPDEDRAHVTD